MAKTLTPEEEQLIRDQVKDAKAKLHLLATGQAIRVFVDQNGERYEYSSVSIGNLRTYIADLESLLPGYEPVYAKPIRFLF